VYAIYLLDVGMWCRWCYCNNCLQCWNIIIYERVTQVILLLLLLLTIYYSSVHGQTNPNCPAATIDISPCVCSTYTVFFPSSVQIDCSNKGLSDSDLNGILTNIPATTKVGCFQLSGNSLTATPDLTKFNAIPSNLNLYKFRYIPNENWY